MVTKEDVIEVLKKINDPEIALHAFEGGEPAAAEVVHAAVFGNGGVGEL